MGSALRLTVHGGSAREAEAAREAAWREMAQADAELSRFAAESALSRANVLAGTGAWFTASRRLTRMLSISHRAGRLTDGRFDPRVIDVLEQIGERAGVILPSTSRGGPWLERQGRSGRIRIASPVDSGGIGKGLGLRWAADAASRAAPGALGVLLDSGGDIVARRTDPGSDAWSVGIEDPASPGELLATVTLRDGALATSSIALRSWMNEGRRVHHLIDPRTGEPAETGLVAVTVAMPDPAWAEVWTKALFLAGRRSIGEEARSRGMAAWWVEEDGSLHMTPAARQQTTWVRHEASAA